MSPLHKGRENLATGMASIPRVSSPQSEDFNASFISEATQTDDFDDPQLGASSRAARSELQSPQMLLRAPSRESPRSQNRSKSAPRKVKPGRNAGVNMFSGLEAGWWSKSDAIKNCERHRQHLEQKKLGVKAAKSGYGHTNHSSHSAHRAFSSNPQDDEDFTPCAGYSGHLPGFRHHDVGKSFCAAAKESRRDRFDHSFRSSS
ncbi:hypothetical protein L596_014817 [Steinernema carpocapsae]|uniref:Uncharacterized protein n=1 Tax=Steinernema carpocapsae TaxID=34508 RepID=A0A4U5ND04_STECR|nr:hypothetical protein L596_014817 [Steinernema carpocapsae]